MSNRYVCRRRELKIKKLTGNPKNTFTKFLELEIWFDFVLVQVVTFLAHSLLIIAVIPGRNLELCTFLICQRLHVSDLFANTSNGRFPDGLHQFHRTFRRFGHRILQTPVRMRWVAKQLRAFSTELQYLGNDRVVVVSVRIVAAVDEHAPGLLA